MGGSPAILVLAALLASCAGSPPGGTALSGGGSDFASIAMPATEPGLELAGKAKIDLPRARLRGACRILFLPPNRLRIDFRHSSLFGAWREDATIAVDGGELTIVDRERGTRLSGAEAIDLIGGHLEMAISPGDLVAALLLGPFPFDEFEDIAWGGKGNRTLAARWRGRQIAIELDERGRPVEFRLRGEDSADDCIVSYRYDGEAGDAPSRYVVTREFGPGRLSLDVSRSERRPVAFPELDPWDRR